MDLSVSTERPQSSLSRHPAGKAAPFLPMSRAEMTALGWDACDIEASLRRIAHYDYWSDKVRRSILADAKADLLIYGNAERAVVEVAHQVAAGASPRDLDSIRGTALFRRVPDIYTELHADDLDSADEGAARRGGDTV